MMQFLGCPMRLCLLLCDMGILATSHKVNLSVILEMLIHSSPWFVATRVESVDLESYIEMHTLFVDCNLNI